MVDFKRKYYKYKTKYHNLLMTLSESGESIDPDVPDLDPDELSIADSDLESELATDAEAEVEEYVENLLLSKKEDITLEVESSEETLSEQNLFHKINGKFENINNYGDDEFIKIGDKQNKTKTKILEIDNNDDFDNFTEMFGILDANKKLVINWKQVMTIYKGIYITVASTNDREDSVIFKGKTYNSWLKYYLDLGEQNDNVLIFEDIEIPTIAKKILNPFKGKIVDFYSIEDQDIVLINVKPPTNKILCIDDLKSFDKFTNNYGYVKDNGLDIDWHQVKADYKGFYLDKNADFSGRFEKAILDDQKFDSWINDLQQNVVYLFD